MKLFESKKQKLKEAEEFHPIRKSGDKWKVYAKHSGKVLGTHDTYEEALDQLKAIEVNMHG